MTKFTTVTNARANLPELVKRVSKTMDRIVITVNGQPKATLMSQEELDSMEATMDVLSDSKLMKAIRQGEEDIKKGKFITLEQLEKKLGV